MALELLLEASIRNGEFKILASQNISYRMDFRTIFCGFCMDFRTIFAPIFRRIFARIFAEPSRVLAPAARRFFTGGGGGRPPQLAAAEIPPEFPPKLEMW